MPAPTQFLVVSAANHNGTTPDTGSYSVDVLELGTPVDGSYSLPGVDVSAGAMIVPLTPLTQVVLSTPLSIETVGEEPVIVAVGGNISITIASGGYAGTYETDYLGAELSVAALDTGPLCLVQPTVAGGTRAGDTLTITPGLWIYGGVDPGDQTWQHQLNGSDIPGGIDLDYTIQSADGGKTFTVRESFGNASVASTPLTLAPFAPTDFTGLTAWFDAADASTLIASDGQVSTWQDKSGQDHHLTQGVDTLQPVTGQRSLGGNNVLDFPAGSSARLERDDALGFTGNPAMTVFIVAETDSLANTITSFAFLGRRLAPTQGAGLYLTSGTGGYSWRYNDGNRIFGSARTGTPEVLTWSRGAGDTYGDASFRIDGGAAQDQTSAANAARTPVLEDAVFLFGSYLLPDGSYSANSLDAGIGEILIYDTELSPAEMDAVLGYLADKWSLSVSPAV